MFSFLFANNKTSDIKKDDATIAVNIEALEALYKYIENRSGIALQKSKALIQNNIISFCKNKNISSLQMLLKRLQNNDALWREFVNLITINETYFFREKSQITEALNKNRVTKNRLDILCAPSSTGEEIYSVVILALESGITNFQVMGIDISTKVIQKAQYGVYNERSVHKIPKNLLNKYFNELDAKYILKDEIKTYTECIECNLFEDKIYQLGKFDIIFSRNMFIYFKDDKKIEAYKRLKTLKKDTYSSIFLGHADVSSKLSDYIRSDI